MPDTPRITATGTYPRITVNVVTGATGPGGGAVDSVNGRTGTVVLGASDVGALPDDTVIPDITGLQATSEKNQPNGYAGLDGDGTIPDNRIPSSIARDTEIGTQITEHDGSGSAHADIRALALPPQYPTPSGMTVQNTPRSADGTLAVLGTAGAMALVPIRVPSGTWDAIGVRTTVAAVSTWRLGIYPVASSGLPDWANGFDAGTVNTNATAGWQWATFTAHTFSGWHYAAILVDAYTAQPTVSLNNERPFNLANLPMDAGQSNGTPQIIYYRGVPTGAMPLTARTPFSHAADSVTAPVVRLRRS